ncbi:MAG: GntR family transcriptional regulator [Thermodesulfobacteriota bacterium]
MHNFKTMHEKIAQDLRTKIINGKIKAGQRVQIIKVAQEYGVSNIPAREAIKKLESEGFLVAYPYRGAVVKGLSLPEVKEIFRIRQILEGQASRLAMENLTAQDLTQLENLLDSMAATQNSPHWLKLNWEFHTGIYRACGLPRLCKIIDDLRNDIHRYLVTSLYYQHIFESAQRQHIEILDACRKRNADLAETATVKHLQHTSDALVRILSRQEGQ